MLFGTIDNFFLPKTVNRVASNNGVGESSGCIGDTSVQLAWRESLEKKKTTQKNPPQYYTAEFIEPRQNTAAPVHRHPAREKAVNNAFCVKLNRTFVRGFLMGYLFTTFSHAVSRCMGVLFLA